MKYIKEVLLIEAILFILIWINNEYIAVLLTFIAVPIFSGILLISLIAEKIERSKISKSYFYMLMWLAIIPVILFLIMSIANGGTSFDWARE